MRSQWADTTTASEAKIIRRNGRGGKERKGARESFHTRRGTTRFGSRQGRGGVNEGRGSLSKVFEDFGFKGESFVHTHTQTHTHQPSLVPGGIRRHFVKKSIPTSIPTSSPTPFFGLC